jgi:hypothetical protein
MIKQLVTRTRKKNILEFGVLIWFANLLAWWLIFISTPFFPSILGLGVLIVVVLQKAVKGLTRIRDLFVRGCVMTVGADDESVDHSIFAVSTYSTYSNGRAEFQIQPKPIYDVLLLCLLFYSL